MPRQHIAFAALRPQYPAPTIAIATGGSLNAGSLYFSVIGVNRVGLNKPSTPTLVSWNAGQKIRLTIPSTFRQGAEEPHRIIIAASNTNSPNSLQPLTWWRGFTLQPVSAGFYQEVPATLPVTLELAYPEQIALGAVLPDPGALAAIANPLDGMVRWITSLSKLFYYDPLSTATVNNTTVLSAGANPGRWLPWLFPDTFSVGSITDVTGERGCLRDVRSLTDTSILFPPPAYALDGSRGPWATYWLCNGTDESGSQIDSGRRVSLEVSQNGLPKSQLFDKRLVTRLQGYVRLLDGSLSTAGLTTTQNDYSYGYSVYTLEQPLLPGYGAAIQVAPRFRQEELDGYLQGSPLETKPSFAPEAGEYVPGGAIWGDIILGEGDRRRVFPRIGASLQVGTGAGIIKNRAFILQPATVLTVPGTNLTNQKITINNNGDVFFRGTVTNEPTEVTRAIASMNTGRSNASTLSAYLACSANDALVIQTPYPTTIRSDYPDVIKGAGAAQGAQLNAPYVVLYVQRQSTGEVREFIGNPVVPNVSSQTFEIPNFTAGTLIGSIPAAVSGNFGFWSSDTVPTVNKAVGAGFLAADSYRAAWCFRYDGSTASVITHSPTNGCIPEAERPVGELFTEVTALNEAIADINARIPAYESAETDEAAIIGQPLYLKANGHVALAAAGNALTAQVAGLAASNTSPTFSASYAPEGTLMRADWTSITGSIGLTPGALYFLSATAGRLTTTPPTSGYLAPVGRALSSAKLDIEIQPNIKL